MIEFDEMRWEVNGRTLDGHLRAAPEVSQSPRAPMIKSPTVEGEPFILD